MLTRIDEWNNRATITDVDFLQWLGRDIKSKINGCCGMERVQRKSEDKEEQPRETRRKATVEGDDRSIRFSLLDRRRHQRLVTTTNQGRNTTVE